MTDKHRENQKRSLRLQIKEVDRLVGELDGALVELGGEYAYEFGIAKKALLTLRKELAKRLGQLP